MCGSRTWAHRAPIFRELAVLPKDTVILQGGARGADSMAAEVARALGLPVETYPAEWERYGRAAGAIRNQRMLTEGKPDRCYAFMAAPTPGTLDMVRRARAAGVPTTVLDG